MTPARITDAAIELLDDIGPEGLTTRLISERLGVSQPTLYSHVDNLDEIRTLVAIRGMDDLGRRVRDSVGEARGLDALRSMAVAYRGFVREHPAVYMLQQSAPPTEEYWASANAAAEEVRHVFRRFGLPPAAIPDAHLVFRATILGFVNLELNEALRDVDHDDTAAFDLFLGMFADALARVRAGDGEKP